MSARIFGGILLAGGLAVSGAASAANILEWQATGGKLSDWSAWGSVADAANAVSGGTCPTGFSCAGDGTPAGSGNPPFGDNDTTFTFDSSTSAARSAANGVTLNLNITVAFSEINSNGQDIYTIDFGKATGFAEIAQGSVIAYAISTTEPNGLNAAALNSATLAGQGNVTKNIYASQADFLANAAPLLTLDSFHGTRDPLLGWREFGSLHSLYVVDTITAAGVQSISNELTSSIPEPASFLLFGIGLAASGFSRRRTV